MPSNPAKPFLVSRTDDPQLQRLNANIAKLAAAKPAGEAFGAFALAAHLADLAHHSYFASTRLQYSICCITFV